MRSSRWQGIEDGRSFQARELAAETGLTAQQVAQVARRGYTRDQIRAIVRTPEVQHHRITVLWGADVRMARRWCEDHEMSLLEVGRTVFPTSMDPDYLRGRRGPVLVRHSGRDGDPYPRALGWALSRQWNREIDLLNAAAS